MSNVVVTLVLVLCLASIPTSAATWTCTGLACRPEAWDTATVLKYLSTRNVTKTQLNLFKRNHVDGLSLCPFGPSSSHPFFHALVARTCFAGARGPRSS